MGRQLFVIFILFSLLQDSVYNNIRQEGVKLEFDICTHSNLTRLHMSMADAFWDKPTGKPSLDAMLKPIWSTWAEYKKDIDQSKLIAYAQRWKLCCTAIFIIIIIIIYHPSSHHHAISHCMSMSCINQCIIIVVCTWSEEQLDLSSCLYCFLAGDNPFPCVTLQVCAKNLDWCVTSLL